MNEDFCFVDVFIEEPGTVDVEVCKQGPEGIPGPPPVQGPTQVDFGTVAASTNEDVDSVTINPPPSVPPLGVQSVMYLITVTDTAGLRKKAIVQATITQNGTDVSWTRYGDIGDAIPFAETLSISAGDLVLNIANNHSADFDVSLLRIVTV
jgi:hypothetical protein